jgi:hypothetical protein
VRSTPEEIRPASAAVIPYGSGRTVDPTAGTSTRFAAPKINGNATQIVSARSNRSPISAKTPNASTSEPVTKNTMSLSVRSDVADDGRDGFMAAT